MQSPYNTRFTWSSLSYKFQSCSIFNASVMIFVKKNFFFIPLKKELFWANSLGMFMLTDPVLLHYFIHFSLFCFIYFEIICF